jgi:hypothetical protein
MHSALEIFGWYCPPTHSVQVDAPDTENLPVPHALQAVAETESVSAVPPAHRVQTEPPASASVSLTEPAGQGPQLASPIALHCTHVAAPGAANESMLQVTQGTVEVLLYRPAPQSVHVVAAGPTSVSVYPPAAHAMQLAKPPGLYSPGRQLMQATPVEAELYCPAAQAVHVVLPVPGPASVIDPAAQAAQAVAESGLYRPGVQAVHVVPPAPAPALVTDPSTQVAQAVAELGLYWPAVQAVHVVPSALVTDPAAHTSHDP